MVVWYLSSVSEKEVDKIETNLQEYTDKKAVLGKQILQRRSKIAKLNKEIDNLEKEKAETSWEKSLPTKEMIDEEATKGVEHAEAALKPRRETNSLEEIL